ncbi:hypothetical protein [Siphonobacter sp.]|uniref:hypothetical protein n=1 Tax=Siphonobacter sp. TaxID=1869184 RepID=UPI003B3AB0F7
MRYFIAFFLGCIAITTQAQNIRYSYVARPDSVLNILVSQRQGLYKQWAQNQQERNAFFGGQSKKDLRNIITTLEQILNKDNEILTELNRMKQAEVTELRRKNSDVSKRVNSYLDESGALMEENKQLRSQAERNRKRVEALENQSNYPFQITICLLIASWVLFFFLRRKKSTAEPQRNSDLR